MNPCSPLPCHSSGENTNTGRKGVQKGRSQRARIRQIYCQITCFFRRLFIFSLGSLIFWGLNNKVLTSTPVSNHGWNYDELPDRPTQDGYLASYIQALGRAAGTLAGESEASEVCRDRWKLTAQFRTVPPAMLDDRAPASSHSG